MRWINPELKDISVPPWRLTGYQEARLRTLHSAELFMIGFFLLPADIPYSECRGG